MKLKNMNVLDEVLKKKIEDYILGISDYNPQSELTDENREAGLDYGGFVVNREKLRKLSSILNIICKG